MKVSTAIMATLCCLMPASDAFLAPSPRSSILQKSASASRRDSSTTMLAGGAEVSAAFTAMQTSVLTVAAANGVGEPGTVDAPGWVLPVGAGAVILLAGLIPLVLKPGDDAAKDMQERDANIWEQNMK